MASISSNSMTTFLTRFQNAHEEISTLKTIEKSSDLCVKLEAIRVKYLFESIPMNLDLPQNIRDDIAELRDDCGKYTHTFEAVDPEVCSALEKLSLEICTKLRELMACRNLSSSATPFTAAPAATTTTAIGTPSTSDSSQSPSAGLSMTASIGSKDSETESMSSVSRSESTSSSSASSTPIISETVIIHNSKNMIPDHSSLPTTQPSLVTIPHPHYIHKHPSHSHLHNFPSHPVPTSSASSVASSSSTISQLSSVPPSSHSAPISEPSSRPVMTTTISNHLPSTSSRIVSSLSSAYIPPHTTSTSSSSSITSAPPIPVATTTISGSTLLTASSSSSSSSIATPPRMAFCFDVPLEDMHIAEKDPASREFVKATDILRTYLLTVLTNYKGAEPIYLPKVPLVTQNTFKTITNECSKLLNSPNLSKYKTLQNIKSLLQNLQDWSAKIGLDPRPNLNIFTEDLPIALRSIIDQVYDAIDLCERHPINNQKHKRWALFTRIFEMELYYYIPSISDAETLNQLYVSLKSIQEGIRAISRRFHAIYPPYCIKENRYSTAPDWECVKDQAEINFITRHPLEIVIPILKALTTNPWGEMFEKELIPTANLNKICGQAGLHLEAIEKHPLFKRRT